MEISGVSTTAALRPTGSQMAEPGAAVPAPADAVGQAAAAVADGAPSADGEARSGGPGYISPFLRYDQGARVAVLYFRDFDTGETQDQIPSQRVVEEYRRAASRLAQDGHAAAEGDRTSGAPKGGSRTAGSPEPGAVGNGASGSAVSGSATASSGNAAHPGPAGSSGAPASSGAFAPPATGGRFSGSPGGLVSMQV
ncbi:hypothetical protein [Azospirillum picis]|uniref:Uncharacterized protein n=1 Tax=Azospirillum picis TaxID=488438 RepID=A0ABU0MDI3_9PROT|nr:hypothetical protein [Azospirillum picis]MBP2297484.1 hypothetical protein [Azospirillum picis]MDQ0531493.1 hypothetical protein [Azospirillum picis]